MDRFLRRLLWCLFLSLVSCAPALAGPEELARAGRTVDLLVNRPEFGFLFTVALFFQAAMWHARIRRLRARRISTLASSR